MSESLKLSKGLLNKNVSVVIDRPLKSLHPKHGFEYMANYGYIEGIIAPDGEELDAYFLGVAKPLETATGIVIAIIHRTDDDDDKLIVVPDGIKLSDDEIEKAVEFQEKWFKHMIVR